MIKNPGSEKGPDFFIRRETENFSCQPRVPFCKLPGRLFE